MTLSLSRITTKIVCYSLIWTSTVDHRTHRPTSKQQRTFANIHLWKHCFPAFHNFFKYGSESSTGAKVEGHESCLWSERSTGVKVQWSLGTFAPEERTFTPEERTRERKFSLWTFRSWERKCRGMKRTYGKLDSYSDSY